MTRLVIAPTVEAYREFLRENGPWPEGQPRLYMFPRQLQGVQSVDVALLGYPADISEDHKQFLDEQLAMLRVFRVAQ